MLEKVTTPNKRNGSKLSTPVKFGCSAEMSTAKEKNPAPSIRKPSQADQAKDSMPDKTRKDLEKALSRVASEAADDEEIIDRVKACDPKQVAASLECAMFEKLRP